MCDRRLSSPLRKGVRVLEYAMLLGVPIAVVAVGVSVLLRKLKTGADILKRKGNVSSGYYH